MDLVKNINMVLIYYLKVNMLMVIGLKKGEGPLIALIPEIR